MAVHGNALNSIDYQVYSSSSIPATSRKKCISFVLRISYIKLKKNHAEHFAQSLQLITRYYKNVLINDDEW